MRKNGRNQLQYTIKCTLYKTSCLCNNGRVNGSPFLVLIRKILSFFVINNYVFLIVKSNFNGDL